MAAFVSGFAGVKLGGVLVEAVSHVAPDRASARRAARTVMQQHELNGVVIEKPLVPVKNYLLVRVAEVPEQTSGGLFLAQTATERPNYGVVVAAGDGSFFPSGRENPMRLKASDVVLYGKYGGQDVTYDGEKHTFVTQDEILCTLAEGAYVAANVRPVDDVVFIKKDKAAEETTSGLALAATAAEKPNTGVVVAVGPGRTMENGDIEPMGVSVGSHVMFGKYGANEVKFEGEDYLLARASDLYAHW